MCAAEGTVGDSLLAPRRTVASVCTQRPPPNLSVFSNVSCWFFFFKFNCLSSYDLKAELKS